MFRTRGDILYSNRNRGSKHNKRIIIATIILISFSLITLLTNRTSSKIEVVFKDTISTIEYYVIKAPLKFLGDVFYEYTEMKDVYEENKKWKQQADKLAREAALNEVLTKENHELRELMEIDYLPTDYQVKYTSVISRNQDNWNNEISIGLGSMSGVKTGMAVINAQGMVGTVTHVTELSANVTLLSSENTVTQLPVMILNGEETVYGLLNKYDIESQTYKVILLSDVEKIEPDATVVTSGLGGEGKSPKGIYIGNVESFVLSPDASEAICNVKPAVDFNHLNHLSVVQRVN